MDANKFMREYVRMCKSCDDCHECPLLLENGGCSYWPSTHDIEKYPKIIKAVENWSAAHPITTRAALFKKTHPFVVSDSTGALLICPVVVDKNVICPLNGECKQCRKNYWLKEAQNGR